MTPRARSLNVALALCLVLVTGCKEEVATPDPSQLTRNAIGHYCNMIVADHPGPKAQVFEQGRKEPLWFSSVRDGLAYLALPGEAKRVQAIYVHDMGRANSWASPQDTGIWINASEAIYVVGSKLRGGMGAKEAVPFKEHSDAHAFAGQHGGRVVNYDDIPSSYIVGDDDDHTSGIAQQNNHEAHGG